jgi:hypothetical protein
MRLHLQFTQLYNREPMDVNTREIVTALLNGCSLE